VTEQPLVLVLTMGRVASTAVYRTIEAQGFSPVFHLHAINPATIAAQTQRGLERAPRHIKDAVEAREALAASNGRVKVVTLVRDAIDRNLSAEFARVRRGRDAAALEAFIGDPTATRAFWDASDDREPHVWFDRELRDGLGVDVYAHPFPAAGSLAFSEGRYDVLVLRQDLDDAAKAAALAGFFDLPALSIVQTNRKSRAGGDLHDVYERFKRTAPYDEDYLRSVAASGTCSTSSPWTSSATWQSASPPRRRRADTWRCPQPTPRPPAPPARPS
jgi:hypothetical protein